MAMYMRILGPVVAESGGTSAAVSANQRHLLALLACRAGHIVGAEQLVDALWGEATPRHPTAALQNLVSRIRSRLVGEDRDLLVTRPPGYGLMVGPGSLDQTDFEDLLARARSETTPEAGIARYDAAFELWRGGPYGEFADSALLRQEAVRLEEVNATAREDRLALVIRSLPEQAVGELEALAAATPYRERVHALLMEALHRSQRTRDALHAYRSYREMLVDELGLDPSPAMQQLEHAILTHTLEHTEAPPGATRVVSRRHNVPLRRTTFVGRSDDMVALAAHLEQARLVTVLGAGGAGKTSLATEVARSLEGAFDDGVWLIDLLQVSDGDHLADHVAATMGLAALRRDQPLASLTEHLASRRALLVLDNCEHVVDQAARLAGTLLDGAEDIRLLATSREPLRLSGEAIHRLAPLDVPAETATPAEVFASAAGQLFVDRVTAADLSYASAEADVDRIRSICRRLDGLPLALELAAARVPSLGLAEVADRIDHRFDLLTSTDRDAIPHHQTLQAAIGWSIDLLDDRHRALLAQLSVFVGGFDLSGAEAVCLDPGDEPTAVVDGLGLLVDRSLVAVRRDEDGALRYRLLETIREFARSELCSDDVARHERHRDWCLHLAGSIGDGFLSDTSSWYARLRLEFPNLRAAFQWCLEQGDAAGALDLVASLRWAPFNTGHLYGECATWIETSLAAARGTDVPAETLGRGMIAAGAVAGLENRAPEAVALLSEALTTLHEAHAPGEAVWSYMWLGAFTADLGDFEQAVEHTRQGLDIALADSTPTAIVYLANQHAENAMAASIMHGIDRYAEIARDAYELAVLHATASGIEEGLIRAENGRALLDATADPARVLAQCTRALAAWKELGHGNRLIMSLVSAARVALLAGEPATAASLNSEAADAMEHVGWRQPLGRLLETAAVHALDTGDRARAALLRGGATSRFLTPRWFVPIGAPERFTAARAAEPAEWDLGVAAGASMADGALLELTRRSAGGVVTPAS
jgi:predicted ATPase/DNA-binding SARP family transcriptional activator